MKTFSILTASLFFLATLLAGQTFSQPNVRSARQGYSMRLNFNNKGVMGKYAYPGAQHDSIGLEYPIGSPYEHIYGAGLWVGGKLDTSRVGTSPQISLVTIPFEGWGSTSEFNPGSTPADSIWKIVGRNVPRPPSWFPYWGNSVRATSFSDNDHYCTYNDFSWTVNGHVPLGLKIIQSSFVWDDPYAEAIHIIEYKIINMGEKQIDSAYVGMFLDPHVFSIGGPPSPAWQPYSFDFFSSQHMGLAHRADSGFTPVGVSVLQTPLPLDSLRFAFQFFPGILPPITNAAKYRILSSGMIAPSIFPPVYETGVVLSFGPFTLSPQNNPASDTLIVAFAIVSGYNVSDVLLHAQRAKNIYLSGGLLSVDPTHKEIPETFTLFQNYPNPFNPTTKIKFSLPEGGATTLKVFDVLGKEVAVLESYELAAGIYERTFDAANLAGGVYFYRLDAGGYNATRKLVLLK